MPDKSSPSPNRSRIPRWLPILLLIPAYFGVRAAVRLYVDQQIEHQRGHRLPDFELADTTGRVVSSESLRGRPAILHFFRSHCVSCEAEKPELIAFVSGLAPDDATFVSVMTDPVEGYDPAVTEATLARSGFTWPVVMADKALLDAFHGAGWSHVTPITYFVDRDGTIITTLRGPQTRQSLADALSAATAVAPPNSGR